MIDKLLKKYSLESEKVQIEISIVHKAGHYVRSYLLDIPEYGTGTEAMLDSLKKDLIMDTKIQTEKMLDPKFIDELKERFRARALTIMNKKLPDLDLETKNALIGILLSEMLGLGKIEFLLSDGNLEEIVVNSSREPINAL